jgi:predicted acetyltransferase
MHFLNNFDYFELRRIIDSDSSLNKHFRYYNNRNKSDFDNHKYHMLVCIDNNIVGYGHLDPEDDFVWLGMFVLSKFRNAGIGDVIVKHLISKSNKNIQLTVDKDNHNALKLYLNNQFKIFLTDEQKHYCIRKNIMADTLGSIVDKLCTVDLKMWNNQELFYDIRRMSFEEYKEKYFNNEEGAKQLWEILKRCADLNVQRNQLIDEVDEKIVEIIDAKLSGKSLDEGKFIQRKHKTY